MISDINYWGILKLRVLIVWHGIVGNDLKKLTIEEVLQKQLLALAEHRCKRALFKSANFPAEEPRRSLKVLEKIKVDFTGVLTLLPYKDIINHLLNRVVRSSGRDIHPLLKGVFDDCYSTAQIISQAEVMLYYWEDISDHYKTRVTNRIAYNIKRMDDEVKKEVQDLRYILKQLNIS